VTGPSAVAAALARVGDTEAPGTGAIPAVLGTPGASAAIVHRGVVVARADAGLATAFSDDGALLPPERREPVVPDLRWDIASLTKLVTTMSALVQVDAGTVDLDAPLRRYLPVGRDRERVLVRHLLTHTSGLPAEIPLWRTPGGRAERAAQVLAEPLRTEPGERHVYSCVGYMTLGLLLEAVTGTDLPDLVARTVTGPLGMTATGYGPVGGRSVASTELQADPPRGMLRAEVHDEAAHALGGAGNAGIFSDVADLVRLGEEVRTGSRCLLRPATSALLRRGMLSPAQVTELGYDQALGFRLGQRDVTGTDDPAVMGHTGFTGTSLVVDPARDLVVVLLTNRVHPRREMFDVTALRVAVTRLARDGVDD
jgi:CubicO group peptidase (beta-lactamase class C family)